MAKRQKKTTRSEYEELLTFVESNKVLLHRKTKPLEIRNIKYLWQTFAEKMISFGIGPRKSADRWKKIFVEWKVNVKRKSRLIHEEITRTGGRPMNTKPLSNLEERLLNLLSKAHLEDSRLPDSLGYAEVIREADDIKVEFEDFDLVNCMKPSELGTLTEINGEELTTSPAGQSSDDVFSTPIPHTVEKTPSKTSEGCNDATLKSNEMLVEALNKFTEVFRVKTEADMLRAKAEMAKAKCLHFQTFGNLDDF